MRKWVITGWSQKADGILIVVDEVSEKDALRKAAKLLELVYLDLPNDDIFCHPEHDVDEITADPHGHRWVLFVRIAEYAENVNLEDAVQW